MRITSIPQLYRNLRRWREIIAVLQRYGLADWLSHFPKLPFRHVLKDRQGVPLTSHSREVRMRLALTELGPTFVKLGQILASRPDLVGPDLANEFKRLHADVPPEPIESIRQTLREELGARLDTEIHDLSETPLAAASIGQVHRARLSDGTEVAVKVQRAGIEETIFQDLDVLAGLAQLADRVPALAAWGPEELVQQIGPVMRRELDFRREQQNLLIFAEMLADHPALAIPRPITALCTHRVLVMEMLNGPDLGEWTIVPPEEVAGGTASHAAARVHSAAANASATPPFPVSRPLASGRCQSRPLQPHRPVPPETPAPCTAATRQQLAKRIVDAYMTMIFKHGVFHADPHPGNLLALPGQRLGILDFGMVGRLDDQLRDLISDMLVAISSDDQALLMRLLKRAGTTPVQLNEAAFSVDVADFIGTYGRQGLSDFDLSGALNDFSALLHTHGIKLPHQSALLIKTLISLEGTLRGLGVELDTLEVLKEYVRREMLSRFHPRRHFRHARRMFMETEYFLSVAPDRLAGLLDQARRGQLSVNLEHHRLSPSVNRLVLGMMASAVFLGSSQLLAMKVPPLLFPTTPFLGLHQISLLGLAGLVVSVLVMMRLVIAIAQSGHLARED